MPFLKEYTMLDELGSGGFATVYKVRHNELGYIRAVRMLKENIATKEGEDPQKNPTYQKFLRECKVLLRLGNGNHPNIVHIYQPRLLENKALVEMDYVDGQDILHYLKQNQNFVPADEVIRMALQMSSALAYCHEDIYRFCMDRDADKLKDDPNDGSKVFVDDQTRKRLIEKYKVIHNDIHSGNIMRREDGNFVLLDFGLAINGDEVVRSSRRRNGAPEFKAPEKWTDESILTEQSDIYSFGVVLYQYLAGRVPFPYNTGVSSHMAEFQLAEAHQKELPPSIETVRKVFFEKKFEGQKYNKDYPQWLEDVIMKCLLKNPVERFRNGKEIYDTVKKCVEQMHAEPLQKMKNECDRLHTELDALRKHANELESINEQLNHKEVDEVEHLKQELTQTKNDRERLEKRVHQLEKVKPNGGKNKWIAYSLLLVVFTCVGLVWYSLSDKTKSHVEPKSSNTANVDSLQQTRSFAVNGVLFKMIFVKGGTFKMGCDSGGEDERPLNSVTVSDFYMGEFEVTQSLWQEVMGTNIYQQRDKEYTGGPMFGVGSNYPMYYVSHTEAEEFCEQLNQQVRNQLPSGYFFTLPTEAQWEYAAKGGDKSKSYTYSGGNHLSDVGWYDNNSSASTNTVGLKVPNELGLYDMSGNVWEWCADWYESYSSSEKKDPMGPSSGLYRVLRGGSWGSSASGCRITRRGYLSPNSRYNYGGFRLVLARR